MQNGERRRSERRPVENLNECVVRADSGANFSCLIQDISPFGMKLMFIGPWESGQIQEGDEMTVFRTSSELKPLLLDARFQVKWINGNVFGGKFTPALELTLGEIDDSLQFTQY